MLWVVKGTFKSWNMLCTIGIYGGGRTCLNRSAEPLYPLPLRALFMAGRFHGRRPFESRLDEIYLRGVVYRCRETPSRLSSAPVFATHFFVSYTTYTCSNTLVLHTHTT